MAIGLTLSTFAYVLWVVEPPLRYAHSAPVFFIEIGALRSFLVRPGGGLEWVAGLMAQTEVRGWVGATLFTALAMLVAVGIAGVVRQSVLPLSTSVFLPSMVLIALGGRYEAQVFEVGGGGLLALAALIALNVDRSRGSRTVVAGWVLTAGLFYVGGWVPATLFVLVGGGLIAIRKARLRLGLWHWGSGILLPTGWFIFPEASPAGAVDRWGNGWSLYVTACFFGMLAAVVLMEAWLARPATASDVLCRDSSRLARAKAELGNRPLPRWLAAGLTTAAVSLVIVSFDVRRKAALAIERAAGEGRWGLVLSLASRRGDGSPSTRLQVHRALYHAGELGDRLFEYPQRRDWDLLATFRDGLDVCLPLSDTLLELGHLNLAERYAHEALEIFGERPAVLHRLAIINVLKDRPKAAQIFLRRLAKLPFHRTLADRELQVLAKDPQLSGDPRLSQIRGVCVKSARAETLFTTPMVLTQAIEAAPHNRMAFEYLTAHFLLTDQVEALVSVLPRFRTLGFAVLPRHVEEAILLAGPGSGRSLPDLAGWSIRAETAARFQQFLIHARRLEGKPLAESAAGLAADFGDTYWFYRRFGRTYGQLP